MKPLVFGIITTLLASHIAAAPLTGKVVAVHDANTVSVQQDNGTRHRIRLAWIAAPHPDHACAVEGRRALAMMTLRQAVQVHLQGDKIDGAQRARVEIPREGQAALDPAEQLIGKGLGTKAEQPSQTQHDHYARLTYLLVENSAKFEKRGVWGAGCAKPR